MQTRILRLNKAGQAMEWIDHETAASLYAKQQIVWSFGDESTILHGGYSRLNGERSIIKLAPVIATEGQVNQFDQRIPKLCNSALFRRDQNLCLYCGQKFSSAELTRDHVMPQARGGPDTWTNCVAACKSCNHFKACRTPDEANMPLLAIPFKPNKWEYLALANRNILADQMQFLVKGFSNNMRRLS